MGSAEHSPQYIVSKNYSFQLYFITKIQLCNQLFNWAPSTGPFSQPSRCLS